MEPLRAAVFLPVWMLSERLGWMCTSGRRAPSIRAILEKWPASGLQAGIMCPGAPGKNLNHNRKLKILPSGQPVYYQV